MSAELKALLEECARQRGALLLQLHELNTKLNDAKSQVDERNQVLQVVIMLLDAYGADMAEDDRQICAAVMERIAALGGRRGV